MGDAHCKTCCASESDAPSARNEVKCRSSPEEGRVLETVEDGRLAIKSVDALRVLRGGPPSTEEVNMYGGVLGRALEDEEDDLMPVGRSKHEAAVAAAEKNESVARAAIKRRSGERELRRERTLEHESVAENTGFPVQGMEVDQDLVYLDTNGPLLPGINRVDSQSTFAEKMQTVIIYDWDDTLFPSSFMMGKLKLNPYVRFSKQFGCLQQTQKKDIASKLQMCSQNTAKLIRTSAEKGHVLIVTLAKEGWVKESCKNFFPEVGKVIEGLKIPIIYAQVGIKEDHDRVSRMAHEEVGKFWAGVKGKAIQREIKKFYSQYEGQTWKNIISIGDSDFERLGTIGATEEYRTMKCLTAPVNAATATGEVDNHVFKVRTKTFKTVEDPTVEDLTAQLAMLHKWLPLMISLDDGFDINLDEVNNPAKIELVECTLRGQQYRV